MSKTLKAIWMLFNHLNNIWKRALIWWSNFLVFREFRFVFAHCVRYELIIFQFLFFIWVLHVVWDFSWTNFSDREQVSEPKRLKFNFLNISCFLLFFLSSSGVSKGQARKFLHYSKLMFFFLNSLIE
jgi:hypothetical protein